MSIALIFSGFAMFQTATSSPSQTLPRGPIWIGAGSNDTPNVTKTEIYLYDGSFLRFLVRFGRSDSTTFFAYFILPFTVDSDLPPTFYPHDLQYDHVYWQNFNQTSAIVNVTGHLDFPTSFDLTLGMEVRANSTLFSDIGPLSTKKSLSITLYGDISGILDSRMAPYMIGLNTTLLNSKPVRLYVEPPLGTLVSSETFPTPISQYMVNVAGEERKSVIFSLDFLGGTNAQTVSCTFVNPTAEYVVQLWIFLAGILSATGVYFILSMLIEFLKERLSVAKMQYD
jgi:hypothetical protein